MILTVKREPNDIGTPGQLFIDGVFECYTLELKTPKDNEEHIKGQCCVPLGTYKILPRFEGTVFGWMKDKCGMVSQGGIPHIQNLKNWLYPKWINNDGILPEQYVLIHIGNKLSDTEGCLLVGMVRDSENTISQSTIAFSLLYRKIIDAMTSGQLTIQYVE